MKYNLLEEKWIPVLYQDGRWDRVGIRKALEDAHRIRQIAASNPMDRVAILRFLLALLYWCRGSPTEYTEEKIGDPFSADWFLKLDENRDCFNILGEGKRFYQDRTAQRRRPVTDLIQEIPTGNNFWHFRHSTDGKDGICPACCVMGLLRLPLFSVSGLPNLKSGINGAPPVYVIPLGASLADTLVTNLTPQEKLGVPAWLESEIRQPESEDVPILTGLTVLARRVWLHDPETEDTCVNCGAKETSLIHTCEFQTAGELRNDSWDDPHVVYLDQTPRKAVRAPDLTAAGKFRLDRPWAGLVARFAETGKFGSEDKLMSLLIVGFATGKAKNIDVWERSIDMPSKQSIQGELSSTIEIWQKEAWRIEKRIQRICRSEVEAKAVVSSTRPHVEHRVSTDTCQLASGSEEEWQKAAEEYRPFMRKIARSLSPGFTTAAVERRREIGFTVPDMRPKTKEAKKPDRKKGGKK
jgi:CRISPR type I-E-associated protein CasA/Cse1